MVENPTTRTLPDGTVIIYDQTTVRPERDWRFIGWVLIGAAIAVLLSDVRSLSYMTGPQDYLPPLLLGVLGTFLVKTGERSRPFLRPLLRISADRQLLERPSSFELERIPAESLTHVVFGLIDMPWPGREDVKVEAFALYLATRDGTPIPVVDGTTSKMAAYRIAELLGDTLELPLIELGKGQPQPRPEPRSEPALST